MSKFNKYCLNKNISLFDKNKSRCNKCLAEKIGCMFFLNKLLKLTLQPILKRCREVVINVNNVINFFKN